MKKSRRFEYLFRKYGITKAQYNFLLKKQKGCCPVCGRSFKSIARVPHVDHNHKTGIIRGLLCGNCNHRVVGRHTDPVLLRRAADYLEKFNTGWLVPRRKK